MRTHGHTERTAGTSHASPTYRSWQAMRQRCDHPEHVHFADYGGRGVTICARWQSFENFLADMGERPAGTSLDRHPNKDGDYGPGNCRWATQRQQQRNRRSNRPITAFGRTMLLVEWAEETGIHPMTLRARLRSWAPERALTEPVSAVYSAAGRRGGRIRQALAHGQPPEIRHG